MSLEQLLQELTQLAEDLRIIKCSRNVRMKFAEITDKNIEVLRYYINYYKDELQQMVDVSQQEILDILGEVVPEAEIVNARKSTVYGNYATLSARLAPSEQEIKDARNSSAFGVNYSSMKARSEAHELKTKDNTTRITAIENNVPTVDFATSIDITVTSVRCFDANTAGTKPFSDGIVKTSVCKGMPSLNGKDVVLQEATNFSTNSFQIAKRLYRYNTGTSNYEWTAWQIKTL